MTEEIFPLVDKDGNVIGEAPRSKCHDGTKLLHPVIHLHVFNSAGELFLQKRSPNKIIYPDKWDSSVSGHVDLGETPWAAALREAKEEIGISDVEIYFIDKYIIETDIEQELSYCYYAIYDGEFVIDLDEVIDGRYWSIDEISSKIGDGIFTFNFEQDFERFLQFGFRYLVENIR